MQHETEIQYPIHLQLFMKKLYAISAIAMAALNVSAQLPGELSWTEYTGDSFVANWEGSTDADITVFTTTDKLGEQSVTFADIIRNDKINMYAAASLEPMFQLSFKAGLGAVGEVDGIKGVMMSSTDDAITVMTPNGFIRNLVVKGKISGAEDVSDYNLSPKLILTALEQDGSSTGFSMQTYAYQLDDDFNGEYNYGEVLNRYYKTLTGVRLSFEKGDDMVGDLVITSIEVTYEERDIIVDKQAVSGESYKVEGCDPALTYYYFLSSKDGSEVTPIMTVDGFLPPATINAEPTSSTSYKASWSTPYKADEVVVANYEVKTFTEAGTAYVYYDNFDKADKGTLELPEMVSSLDPYTEVSGWETFSYAGRIAEGMIGTFKSNRPYPPMGGYLYSPAFDLTGNDGKYTIATRIYGTPGDVITVYRDMSYDNNYVLNSHKLTIGEDGWAEDEWEMTDGNFAANGDPIQSIHFESAGVLTFLLDYLYLTQEVPAGYTQYIPCGTVTVDASESEVEFTDLNEGATYAFRVQSIGLDLAGNDRNSEWTDYKYVSLQTTGIVNIADDLNNTEFDPNAPALYFTPDGRAVDSNAHGIVIVRQGEKTFKMVR